MISVRLLGVRDHAHRARQSPWKRRNRSDLWLLRTDQAPQGHALQAWLYDGRSSEGCGFQRGGCNNLRCSRICHVAYRPSRPHGKANEQPGSVFSPLTICRSQQPGRQHTCTSSIAPIDAQQFLHSGNHAWVLRFYRPVIPVLSGRYRRCGISGPSNRVQGCGSMGGCTSSWGWPACNEAG